MKRVLYTTTLVLLSIFAFSQTYSSGDGEWSSVVDPSYNVQGGDNIVINNIVSADNKVIVRWGGSLTIGDGAGAIDSLIINNELQSEGGSTLTVNADGIVRINGDVLNRWGGSVIVNGELSVDGNVDNEWANVTINNGGTLKVNGQISTLNPITNNGQIITNSPIIGPVNGTGGIDDSNASPLPIKLNFFTATQSGNNVSINWQTGTEENNDYFTIERSDDGINFEPIGTIWGAGNSSIELNYEYTDIPHTSETLYYRLRQTDYNGDYEVFKIVSVDFKYDNSIKNTIATKDNDSNITFDLGIEYHNVNVTVTNITGHTIKSEFIAQTQEVSVYKTDLHSGIYIINIYNNSNLKYSYKITK